MNSNGYVPAKKSVVLILLAVWAVIILGFAFLLRTDLRRTRLISPADYTGVQGDNFRYSIDIADNGGAVVFSGWALYEGEKFESVDTAVVLYCAADDTYTKLPTIMSPRDDASESVTSDEINYSFGGFYSFVPDKKLAHPLSDYEICFAYRCNAHNEIIHTKQSAEVTAQ